MPTEGKMTDSGENICKSHITLDKEKKKTLSNTKNFQNSAIRKQTQLKNDQRHEKTCLQRYMDDKEAYSKMLNIISH